MTVFFLNIVLSLAHDIVHNSTDFHRFTNGCINVSGSHLCSLQVFVFSIDILQIISFVPSILWSSLY